MALTREQMFGGKLKLRKVSMPEWEEGDGHVYIRPMPSGLSEAYEELKADDKAGAREVSRLTIVTAVCDKDGTLIFNEDDKVLGGDGKDGLPFLAVQRLSDEILAFNGMTDEGAKDLEGNLDGDPGDNSSSS